MLRSLTAGSGPGTQSGINRRRCDKGAQSCGSCTVEFATDVIAIDESDGGTAASTASASRDPVGIDDGDNGPAFQKSLFIDQYDRTVFRDMPCDNARQGDWKIRDCA